MTTTIGVDVGGSSVEAVVRDLSGQVLERHHHLERLQGGSQVAAMVVSAARALDLADCIAVGVGVPGQVDRDTGKVRLAVNLGIGVEPFDLVSAVENELGLPVVIENDVRAAALGAYESLTLAGQRPDSLALMSIGTGISAGVVIGGVLVRGAQGMAGEVGHVVVDENGPVCRCGQRGCLEAMAAGPAIGRAWPRGDSDAAATALFGAAAAGDPAPCLGCTAGRARSPAGARPARAPSRRGAARRRRRASARAAPSRGRARVRPRAGTAPRSGSRTAWARSARSGRP